ncbi:hypothetical protein [Corynebacterium freiburgense]|uniref:hypothetical protein n=1 Tax=Corynebacterium freiburgense TaxID=556548 RepID=UPI000425BF4E|nr:hypothetical protein [Corynebacterium freiburgense]WJZ02810.1 hypothetical protein CFREI_07625 [Corynebacterium freiburgense]
MNRATPFLAAFNDIEQYLRRTYGSRNTEGFRTLVRMAMQNQAIPQVQADALFAFADLRNAISHGAYNDGKPIAEPFEKTVTEIESLRDLITKPPAALAILGERTPQVLTPATTITEALRLLHTDELSALPVYRKSFTFLLTTDMIVRWVAEDLDDDGRLNAHTVSDLEPYATDMDTAHFGRLDISAATAIHHFTDPGHSGLLPRAIILNARGTHKEPPIRIIDRAELPKLVQALEF